MRLIGTIKDPTQARRFSGFLTTKGIQNQLEQNEEELIVWVYDEDDVKVASEWLEKFYADPNDTTFENTTTQTTPILKALSPENPMEEIPSPEHPPQQAHLTLSFLIICIVLFAASFLTAPAREEVRLPYPYVAVYSSEVTQGLLFDFPKAYQLLEEISDTYGIKALANPATLPPQGQQLLKEYSQTPWWKGYYNELLLMFKGKQPQPWEAGAPWFEQIRQGQVWRLFTPALLHLDIFHLLFNMVWLMVLGKQIELRIGAWRYLLFCLLVGVFANVCQYFVSGPNFIGFSGILCGFFTFIWIRQKKAPWEGYQLQSSTIAMIGIFVGALLLIQVASFITEVYASTSFAPMIANTAHIAGGVGGIILGRLNFFAWKSS